MSKLAEKLDSKKLHTISFFNQKRGKQLVDANHVQNVEEHRKNGTSYFIQAQVIRQTSITSPPYKGNLNTNSYRNVISSLCNCVYNQSGKCKHIAALIYFINFKESLSKTNFEQQWGKPTARQFAEKKYCKGKNFSEMYRPREELSHISYVENNNNTESNSNILKLTDPSAYKNVMIELTKDKNESAIKNLMSSILTQVDVILEKEKCVACLDVFFILCKEHKFYESVQIISDELQSYYMKHIVLSREQIIELCCDTLKQSLSDEWFIARRLRISARKSAHNIKCRKTKTIDSLIREILYPKKVDTSSTRYGLAHESDACQAYESLFNVNVKKVGVIICQKQPWLCGSLDGIVVDDLCISKIVEFKCTSSCKIVPVVDCDTKKCNVNILEFGNNGVKLKESSIYYTQCQLQMYISGLSVCDLFVFSPVKNGTCCVTVFRNEDFLAKVVLECEEFYFQQYLPVLYQTTIKKHSSKMLKNVPKNGQRKSFSLAEK